MKKNKKGSGERHSRNDRRTWEADERGGLPSPGAAQRFGTLHRRAIGLPDEARRESVERLNEILADTITLRELYKKHHWQVAGPTFYQLHLMFDKHYEEQNELVDEIAERVQMLGGVTLATPHDVAQTTQIERPPRDAETVPAQLARLLRAHETVLVAARKAAAEAAEADDQGTNDLLVSDVIRTNEMHVWFVSEHLEPMPLLRPEGAEEAEEVWEESAEEPRQ